MYFLLLVLLLMFRATASSAGSVLKLYDAALNGDGRIPVRSVTGHIFVRSAVASVTLAPTDALIGEYVRSIHPALKGEVMVNTVSFPVVAAPKSTPLSGNDPQA